MKGLSRQQLLEAGKRKLQEFREQKRAAAAAAATETSENGNYINEPSVKQNGFQNISQNEFSPRTNATNVVQFQAEENLQVNTYDNQIYSNGIYSNNNNIYQINSNNMYEQYQDYGNYGNFQNLNQQPQDYYQQQFEIDQKLEQQNEGLASAYASLSDAYLGSTAGATISTSSSPHPPSSYSNFNPNSDSQQNLNSQLTTLQNLSLNINQENSSVSNSNKEDDQFVEQPASPIIKEISLSTSFLPQNYMKSNSNQTSPRDERHIPSPIPETEPDSISENVIYEHDEDFSLDVPSQEQLQYQHPSFEQVIASKGVGEERQLIGDGEQGQGQEQNHNYSQTQDIGQGQGQGYVEESETKGGPMSFLSQMEQSRVDGYRQQIKELQRFIDELTQEKYELMRGLEKQNDITNKLAAESATAGERLIQQQQENEGLKEQLVKYEKELQATQMAHVAAASERDAARQAVEEAQHRGRELAAEIVHMEDAVQRSQLDVAKREKGIDAVKKQVVELENKLKGADRIHKGLESQIGHLQVDKKNLMTRLRDLALSKGMVDSANNNSLFQQQNNLSQAQIQIPKLNMSTQTTIEDLQQNEISVDRMQQMQDGLGETDLDSLLQGLVEQGKVPVQILHSALFRMKEQQSQNQVSQDLQQLAEFLPSSQIFGIPQQILTDQQTVLQGINKLVENFEAERHQIIKVLRSKDNEIASLKSQNKELSSNPQNQLSKNPSAVSLNSALTPNQQLEQQLINHRRKDTSDSHELTITSTTSIDFPPVSVAEPQQDQQLLKQNNQGGSSEIEVAPQESGAQVIVRPAYRKGWGLWGRQQPDRAPHKL